MDSKQFGELALIMKAAYHSQNFLIDKKSVAVWFELLKDMDYEVCKQAVLRHISMSKFPPTIADIRGAASENKHHNDYEAEKAWDMVYKAIGNSNYNSVEEFEKLPPLAQKVVGSPGNLRELAMADEESVLCEKGRFVRKYDIYAQREKEFDEMPPSVRNLIGQTKEKMIEG